MKKMYLAVAFALLLPGVGQTQEKTTAEVKGTAPLLSPDGKYVAVRRFDRTATPPATTFVLYDIAAKKEVWDPKVEGTLTAVTFSSDSKLVAVATTEEVSVYPTGKGFGRSGPKKVKTLAFGTTGDQLAVIVMDGKVLLVDRKKGEEEEIFKAEPVARWIKLSPDGKRVYVLHGDSVLECVEIGGKSLWKEKVTVGFQGELLALSPDGKTLAVASGNKVLLLDAGTGKTVKEIEPEKGLMGLVTVSWAADGKTLLAVGNGPAAKAANALPEGRAYVLTPDGTITQSVAVLEWAEGGVITRDGVRLLVRNLRNADMTIIRDVPATLPAPK